MDVCENGVLASLANVAARTCMHEEPEFSRCFVGVLRNCKMGEFLVMGVGTATAAAFSMHACVRCACWSSAQRRMADAAGGDCGAHAW